MATSAIGPGFLTQTTVFTSELLTSFGFVILISILLDIGAQLNIWRIITLARKPAQELADMVIPGAGIFLSILVAFGGLAFNIGNIAGTGLGMQALFGIAPTTGAVISTVLVLILFGYRQLSAMDIVTRVLGFVMIGVTLAVAVIADPPLQEAVTHTFLPLQVDYFKIITIVGGTVGGYISFAGGHRLLDAGIGGPESIREVTRSSVTGIVLTSVMRYVLFLAVLGVVASGVNVSAGNPAASVFENVGGTAGRKFFGLVMWSASITSVIGASYTSITFLRTLHPAIAANQGKVVSMFVLLSLGILIVAGHPVLLLIVAGAVNGLILPVALATMLMAANRIREGNYDHPVWLRFAGWAVVAAMAYMAGVTIVQAVV